MDLNIPVSLFIFLLSIFIYFRGKKYPNPLPPGSLGLPVIGQSLELLKALKADEVEKWFQEGINKHGPIWKANLFGYPTVVLHGPAANKFIYTCDSNVLARHDTTSILLAFLVKVMANNESVYSNIVREHEEIAMSKPSGEALTWDDLTKMKYSWRVASEVQRINPPAVLTFRRAMQDIEYGGFAIPKGWQKHAPQPPPFCLVAFGAGPRMCPGVEFAKMETLVMLHRLVTQFTWELVNKDESFKRIPLPEFDQGLLVRITPIKAS
ncbi:hypothetical protein LXL04_027089 [Taraxacum kok-saghyz]